MRGVRRQVGDRDAGADDRGLVADRVDAVEQVRPRGRRRGLAHVELVRCLRAAGGAVGALEHQVDPDHLVAGGLERSPIAVPMKPAEPVSRTFTRPVPGCRR